MDTGEGSVRDILNDSGVGPESEGANGAGSPPALPQSLSPGGRAGAPQEGKLIFGKYKSIEEAEKGHKALNATYTQETQKRKALEALLQNKSLKTLAASDPQIKDALTKAGYTLAEEEEKAEEQEAKLQGDVWNGDENDPRYQVRMIRRELDLRDQKQELEAELKRRLKPEEIAEIKEVMKTVSPTMALGMAWKLTPSFEKAMKERQDKELAKARGPERSGTRPPPFLGPQGQNGANAAKRPSQMSAMEKRNALLETVRKNS